MKFPDPPVRTPLTQKDPMNNEVVSRPWIEWFQAVTVALSSDVPTVTGARGGNVALTNLMTDLATLGIVVDNTTP